MSDTAFDQSGNFVAKDGRRIVMEREERTFLVKGLITTGQTILEDPETAHRTELAAPMQERLEQDPPLGPAAPRSESRQQANEQQQHRPKRCERTNR